MLIRALLMGIRDFVSKTKSPGVIVGLSGGIDSAVVGTLAVRALGCDRVLGVRLPSRFSSEHSLEDAQELADNLGIQLKTISIEETVHSLRQVLGLKSNLSDQNLQARVRGIILMALANETGRLLLSTSNKSELAMGYGTLYGDLCGALMPIGDLYKTKVWKIARALNLEKNDIPERSILKAPSAELDENQLDQDSLPPYSRLDIILERYLDRYESCEQIERETHFSKTEIEQTIDQVHRMEFKRKQAPPILMVSPGVFGEARRWPIVGHLQNHKLASPTIRLPEIATPRNSSQ
ncbi:MAG: NAD(+) synthase [Myxococcaceae bacterium]|nr:NAD(+) synthase [Myxococcaceae bacterium]